jgi:hypothetical protein
MRSNLWEPKLLNKVSLRRDWASLVIFCSTGFIMSLTGVLLFTTSAHYPMLSAGRAAVNSAQVQGMAGAVLNSETSMNTIYTRKLNQELMNRFNEPLDDGPLIQYVGPPPQPPVNGPLLRPLTQVNPRFP